MIVDLCKLVFISIADKDNQNFLNRSLSSLYKYNLIKIN